MGGEEEMLVANLGKIMDKATLSYVAAGATRTMPAREGGTRMVPLMPMPRMYPPLPHLQPRHPLP